MFLATQQSFWSYDCGLDFPDDLLVKWSKCLFTVCSLHAVRILLAFAKKVNWGKQFLLLLSFNNLKRKCTVYHYMLPLSSRKSLVCCYNLLFKRPWKWIWDFIPNKMSHLKKINNSLLCKGKKKETHRSLC